MLQSGPSEIPLSIVIGIFSIYKLIVQFTLQQLSKKMNEGTFGRPEDKDIEREFMKKIRGDKLQAINAECELEICLAFKNEHKKEKSRNKRNKKRDAEVDTQALENLMMTVPIGKLQVDRREALSTRFKALKESWKFEEIAQDQPLPDYFFQDGCDLSYILYELQNTGEPQFQIFNAEDLIFLELLCLEGRKLLNENIIQYFEKKMDFMILAMQNGLEKISQKLKVHKGDSKSKERKISQEDEPQYLISSEPPADTENQKSEKKKYKKTKIIKKSESKVVKKVSKGKGGQESEPSVEEEPNDSHENNYPQEEELALKTCNYISWAYWYVIKKE